MYSSYGIMLMMVLLIFDNKSQVLKNQLLKIKKIYCFPTDELHKSLDLPDLLKINAIAEQEVDTFVHNYFINNLHITYKSASMKKEKRS